MTRFRPWPSLDTAEGKLVSLVQTSLTPALDALEDGFAPIERAWELAHQIETGLGQLSPEVALPVDLSSVRSGTTVMQARRSICHQC